VVPDGTLGFDGDTVIDTRERTPIPVRELACGLSAALSVTVSVPFLVPTAVGVNFAEMPQLAPAATVLGETGHVVDEMLKSLLARMLLIASAMFWLLVSVTVCPALAVP